MYDIPPSDKANYVFLEDYHKRIKLGDFRVDQAADYYARVQLMRERADYYERELIRYLKHEHSPRLTWAQVAAAVRANLSSRQAAQVRWRRLIDAGRRQPGAPGRGGRPKGSAQTQ